MFISMFIVIIGVRMMELLIIKNNVTLCNNQSAVTEHQNDTLKQIAIELAKKIRKSTTVAWQERDIFSSYRGLR